MKILPTPILLAAVFLRLGTTAFGGPAAHIAMMEDEVVCRRRWLTREQFLDYVGATNLIPGPNSTELAIHIGHARGGWPGLVAAGVAFILPATLIVMAAAWAYQTYGSLPQAAGLLYGVKPVIIAVVAQALWRLGRIAVKGPALAVVGLAAIAAVAAGLHELVVLAAAAVVTMIWATGRRLAGGAAAFAGVLLEGLARSGARPGLRGGALAASGAAGTATAAAAAAAASAATAKPFALWTLFLVLAKAGSVLFGSGYVLLAFLRADLVERLGWLTEAQLLDAIAVGQVTPGPVFTTATFVGYILGGPAGAAVATAGIFLPAFVFVALSGPFVPRLRRSAAAGAALDGVNVASLALMAVVAWQLGRAALVDPLTIALAVASLAALVWTRLNPAWLVLAGALVGMLT